MATSGTYAFSPSVGELVLSSYARCQIRRPEITAEHMMDARNEANLLQVEWSNRGVTLWTVDLQSIALTENVATYDVNASTITILDAFIRTTSNGVNTDRYIGPVSRSEYAAFPNKTGNPAPPTVYWYDRLIAPTVTVWPVPDGNGPYTLYFYRYRQIQDANIPSGVTPEVPYRWLDAAVAGLAARLATIRRPDLSTSLDAKAERAFGIAANQDVEGVPFFITPGLGTYYR